MEHLWVLFVSLSFTAILAVIAGVWAMDRAVRKFTYYSISAKRVELSCEEIPLFEHHYWTEHELRREWSLYGQDIFDAGYESDGDWQPLTLQGIDHSQIVVRNIYKHTRTGAVLVMEAKVVKGFREFSDHIRRRISGGKKLAPGDANRLRKEVLANNYPEVGDKRYYTYIVTEEIWDYGATDAEIRVSAHRSAQSAMDWIQAQEHFGEETVVASEFPVHIDYDGDKLWRYRVFRELF